MTKIEVLQLFRHGAQTFRPGEVRIVDDADAATFCAAGWARADSLETGQIDLSPQVLNVHNSTLGQRAANLGA